eukprot:2414790-Amphidinium_carterae.1
MITKGVVSCSEASDHSSQVPRKRELTSSVEQLTLHLVPKKAIASNQLNACTMSRFGDSGSSSKATRGSDLRPVILRNTSCDWFIQDDFKSGVLEQEGRN